MHNKFNTFRTILILQAVICIASCSPQDNKTPEGSAVKQDESAGEQANQANAATQNAEVAAKTDAQTKAADTTNAQPKTGDNSDTPISSTNSMPALEIPSGMPKPPCMAGGTYDGELCVCGDMKYPVETAVQWTCFGDFLRCLRKDGCRYNDVTYPTFTKIKASTVVCGEDDAPENPDGFVCSTNVKRYEYMLSLDLQKNKDNPESVIWLFDGFTKHESDEDKVYSSFNESGERDLFWTNDGDRDFDIKPEQDYWVCTKDQCECHGIMIENTDICTNQKVLSVYFPDYITENDNICRGMIYPAKSHLFGYDCRDGNWVCVGKDCQCPSQIKDGRQEYKTIHLGDVCRMKGNVPVHSADRAKYKRHSSTNHYPCDSEDKIIEFYDWIKDSQCYCGDTYTRESFDGGCAYTTTAVVTVYCTKKFDDEGLDDEMKLDEKTGLYIANINEHWGGGSECLEDDDEQEEQPDSEEESAADKDLQNNIEPKSGEPDNQENGDISETTEEPQETDDNTKTTDENPVNEEESQAEESQTKVSEDLQFYTLQWFDDHHQICMNYRGCDCDEMTCPMSTACVDGKCMDPVTKSEIRYGDFLPTIQCRTPSACGCSEKKCAQGEWCVAGNCYSEIVAPILHNEATNKNERDFYNIYGVTTNHPEGMIKQYNDNEAMIYNGLAFEGNLTISPEIYKAMKKGYSNTDQEIYEYRGCCGDDGDEHQLSFRCVLPNGCHCGSSTCQMGGICENRHCKYDQYYIDMMCYDNHNIEELHREEGKAIFNPENPDIRVDDAGNCVCHGTRLSPKLFNTYEEAYICSDYGWLCKEPCGCACGDVMCDANSLCIAPGVCSEPLPGDEYKIADSRENCYKQALDHNKPTDDRTNTDKRSYYNLIQRQNDCKRNHCIMNRNGYCCGTADENGLYQFNGVLDENGDCCFSGVLDDSGNCDTQAAPKPRATNCMMDSHGLCCDSGVLDLNGRCCPKDAISDHGKCYIQDAQGQYCKNGVLDHDKKCCSSGVLNQSGQCSDKDALGEYCDTGVLSETGYCCPKWHIGSKGQCLCPTDNDGHCCILNRFGECCSRYKIDACGNCTE